MATFKKFCWWSFFKYKGVCFFYQISRKHILFVAWLHFSFICFHLSLVLGNMISLLKCLSSVLSVQRRGRGDADGNEDDDADESQFK